MPDIQGKCEQLKQPFPSHFQSQPAFEIYLCYLLSPHLYSQTHILYRKGHKYNCTEIFIFHSPVHFGKHCILALVRSLHYFGLMSSSLVSYHIQNSQTGRDSEFLQKMVIGNSPGPRSLRPACTSHEAREHAHPISCFFIFIFIFGGTR